MAVVPVARNQERLQGLPGGGLQAADFGAGGEAIGRAAAGLGQSIADYSGALQAREIAVDDAAVKQRATEFSAGATNILYGDGQTSNGYKGLRGANALSARGDAEKALRKLATDTLEQTKDPRQRDRLAAALGPQLNEGLRSIGSHAIEQTLQYDRETHAAKLGDLTNQAVLASDTPEQFGRLIGATKDEVLSRSKAEGWGETQTNVALQSAQDDIYTGVVEKMANTDPLAAKRYLDLHRDVVSAKAQTILDAKLQTHVEDATADQYARIAYGGMPIGDVHPTALSPNRDALFQGTRATESAGRTGLVSSKGARGTMQVMPETAKAVCAELGIPYDEQKLLHDPEYCDRIGRAYQDGLLRKYGGNATLATAAYNAGPAAVDDWRNGTNRSGKNKSGLKLGDPLKGEISDADFVARIPFKETRAYVPMVLNRAAAVSGAAGTMPPAEPYAAKVARLDALNLPPDLYDKALTKLNRQVATADRAVTDGQKRAYEQVLPSAMTATDLKQIPVAQFSAMSPEQQKTVVAMIDHNAKGTDAAPNPKLYLQAVQASVDDPGRFSRMDLGPLVGKLPKGDIEKLQTRQAEILKDGASAPKNVAYGHIGEVTNDLLAAAGLTTTGTKGAAAAAMSGRIVTIRSGIEADVNAYHAANGKWPDDTIIRQFAMKRTAKVTSHGDMVTGDVAFRNLPPGSQVTVEVPNAARAKIIEAARRAGRSLNEAQIGHVYLYGRP